MTRAHGGRRGAASVEAALTIAVVLVPLTFGMLDFGKAVSETARLDRALGAALFHVWANPGAFTPSTVQQAAQAGYGPAAPALTVNAAAACFCVSSYTKVASVACNGTCPAGQSVGSYLTISAAAQLALPATIPGVPSPMSLSVQGTVRTK